MELVTIILIGAFAFLILMGMRSKKSRYIDGGVSLDNAKSDDVDVAGLFKSGSGHSSDGCDGGDE